MNSQRLEFVAADGRLLSYKAWTPALSVPSGVSLVLLHRGHEHADRWDGVVGSLAPAGASVFAWDARGHGRSPGERGHADGFMQYVRDLEAFFDHLRAAHGLVVGRTVVVAHSVGAVVAATWAHDFAPRLAGLVLAAPAFDVNLIVPGALAGVRALRRVRPGAVIKSYVRGEWLTRDAGAAAAYDADASITKDISARVLVDLFETSRRVVDDASAMDRPLLLLTAGADRVVRPGAIARFYENHGAEVKIHHTLPGARHGLFHDLCRDEVCGLIRGFAARCVAAPAPTRLGADLSHAATTREYAALTGPACAGRAAGFALQRAALGTLGRLSAGIRIGHAAGFDSGESLDYVYENRARGSLGVGRLIDRAYLDAIGWRGIRQRRVCLDAALRHALGEARRAGLPARVMDIAGGGGRYLLDLLADPEIGPELRVRCRDWSETALATGRAAAAARGLDKRIVHERADAFDEEAVASVRPSPSVAVVSGLYELFPDNARLRRSLRGLARAVPEGGCLVYTNQPWHPQVEMIARTLTNRDGRPWIMRRRPQVEMDALVAESGFVKERQWVDDFGIFTVSVARRCAAAISHE